MITTKITIKQHLAEYCIGKWSDELSGPVRFPSNTELYLTLYDLTQKRPEGKIDDGNLEIILPAKSKDGEAIRKNPVIYNYLSARSCNILDKKISNIFWAELHEYIAYEKHRNGIPYIDSVCAFMHKYNIQSITEDALLKNYQRWRQTINQRNKRAYRKKNKLSV